MATPLHVAHVHKPPPEVPTSVALACAYTSGRFVCLTEPLPLGAVIRIAGEESRTAVSNLRRVVMLDWPLTRAHMAGTPVTVKAGALSLPAVDGELIRGQA